MKLLAIDTSTKVAGVALMQDGALVCEASLTCGLTHSERLMPLIDGCMKLACWQPCNLDAVATVAGPGSFTGVRIGVSAAKGIAEAAGCPVIAVNTLEVLAASFPHVSSVVVPILDARRGQVYAAVYGPDMGELLPPAPIRLADLLAHPAVSGPQTALFAGDGVAVSHESIRAELGARARFAPPHLLLQRPGAAAWLAWRKLEAGDTMDAAALLPLYLRKSSAEQVRESRQAEDAHAR